MITVQEHYYQFENRHKKRHEMNTFMYNMLPNEVEMVTEDIQEAITKLL